MDNDIIGKININNVALNTISYYNFFNHIEIFLIIITTNQLILSRDRSFHFVFILDLLDFSSHYLIFIDHS